MHILLTNDDGVYAEGIQALAIGLVKADIQISIVAPDHERSAVGHAITMHRPLRAEKVKFLHNPDLTGIAVNGTPADCVKLAVDILLPENPQLVISGINRGYNLGNDVLYSGTVSAAMEACLLGIPAIAVSLADSVNPDFEPAATFIADFIPLVAQQDIFQSALLNINIPGIKPEEIKGVRITKLGSRLYRNPFQKRTDPRGRSYYWLAGELIDAEEKEGIDVHAVKNNYISITPVHFDLTDYQMIERMADWPSLIKRGENVERR